jgi:long-subunit fatty acid transport protein
VSAAAPSRARAGAGALLVAAALAPGAAHASFWELYGMNPRAIGTAGAQTALADDFTTTFYNPAALTDTRTQGFGVAWVASAPALDLTFERGAPTPAARDPEGTSAIVFGAHFTLAGDRATNRAALGLAFSIPTGSLLAGRALDPAVPHWSMYEALPERIAFAASLGLRPLDWLSLGVGMQVLAGLDGSLDYALDVVAGRFTRKTVVFDIIPRAAPILGLELTPIEGLRIGATYRGRILADVNLPVRLELNGLVDLDVATRFDVQFWPHTFTFAASYVWPALRLTATAEVGWLLWSSAPDPAVDSRIVAGGQLLDGTGLAGALDVPAAGQERAVDLGYRDVLVPRVAIEHQTTSFLTLRAGYALRPSPAPLQTSGTNYVDGTAHHLALGASARFRDPLGLLANPLVVDLGGTVIVLPERRHTKIDPSDPVGTFTASGVVGVVGVGFRYLFGEAAAEVDRPGPGT